MVSIVYLFAGDIEEAYFHCLSVEKTKVFCNNIDWVTFAVDVFDKYFKLAKGLWKYTTILAFMSY